MPHLPGKVAPHRAHNHHFAQLVRDENLLFRSNVVFAATLLGSALQHLPATCHRLPQPLLLRKSVSGGLFQINVLAS